MAAGVKVFSFSTALCTAQHDFSSDTFKLMLSNTAPDQTEEVISDITEISAGNGYTAGGEVTTVTLSNDAGVEKIVCSDVTWTGAGGSFGPFRYVWLVNDTKDLAVGYWDNGSSITVTDPGSFKADFNGTLGAITVG